MPGSGRSGTAFRLLDLGFFRVGGEQYAEDNGSYGLATIEKQHVHVDGDEVGVRLPAKSGQERLIAVADRRVIAAVSELRARRGGGREAARVPRRHALARPVARPTSTAT
jgi:DNA topoisomerase IB